LRQVGGSAVHIYQSLAVKDKYSRYWAYGALEVRPTVRTVMWASIASAWGEGCWENRYEERYYMWSGSSFDVLLEVVED